MGHTTNKGKKVTGVSVSLTKRAKKAGNKRWVSTITVWDLNVMIDEEVAVPGQDEVGRKLEVMMKILT